MPLQLLLDAIRSPDSAAIILPYLLGLVLALVAGISFHEFAHAFTAYRLGDPTPRLQGRITLNPSAHLDPVGMLLFVVAGFGWGRPVQFDPRYLRIDQRAGSALVALAGPASNILLGLVCGLILRIMLLVVDWGDAGSPFYAGVALTLASFVDFNFILAVFNLLPIPPLDGSKILPALLPPDMAYGLERFYAQIGAYSLLLLFALFWVAGRFIGPLLSTPVEAMFNAVVGVPFGGIIMLMQLFSSAGLPLTLLAPAFHLF